MNETIKKIMFEISQKKNKLIIVTGKKNKNNLIEEKLKTLKNANIFNLNLSLSKILINCSKNELNDPIKIIEELISQKLSKDVIVFTQINILYDINLKWNVIDILKKISRNQLLIVFWDGDYKNNVLYSSAKGHLEYKEYPINTSEAMFIS
jgi:hypothetical protein